MLSAEQAEILRFAKNGHKLLITGQAGTATFIRNECHKQGRKVSIHVVCSSGIACSVYEAKGFS